MNQYLDLLVFALFYVSCLIFIFALIWPRLKKAYQSASWPNVSGVILSSYVEKGRGYSGKGGHRTVYHHRIRYLYHVDGREFLGNKVSFGSSGGSEDDADVFRYFYSIGSTHDVYYNPNNPAESVLEPGLPLSPLWVILILFFVFFFGFAFWLALTAEPGSSNSGFYGPSR